MRAQSSAPKRPLGRRQQAARDADPISANATSDHRGDAPTAGRRAITTAVSAAPNSPTSPSANSNERLPGARGTNGTATD